jgi:hypothetical protein
MASLGLGILLSCSGSDEEALTDAVETTEIAVNPTAAEPEPEGAVIQGQASVELRIQKKQVLGGIELVLVPEGAAERIITVRNQQWLTKASRFKFNDGYNNLDLNRIGGTAVSESVARTKANADGQYRFVGLEAGNYRLYGQYKSRYASGFWLVPVEITSPEDEIELDLSHENMHEIHNREMRYWHDK